MHQNRGFWGQGIRISNLNFFLHALITRIMHMYASKHALEDFKICK